MEVEVISASCDTEIPELIYYSRTVMKIFFINANMDKESYIFVNIEICPI